MLHRCPMNKLLSTMNGLPILSTYFLLLLQSQIFHALPTSSLPSTFSNINGNAPQVDVKLADSSPSSTYDPAYSYSSYRPGARLEYPYRPYHVYNTKEESAPTGLYIGESLNPNSVYSPQSSFTSPSQNLNKVLQFIEKEVNANDMRQQQIHHQYDNKVTRSSIPHQLSETDNDSKDQTTVEPRNIFRQRSSYDNKPRLQPLPSIDTQIKRENTAVNFEQKTDEYSHLEPIPDLIPPPFAPELDAQYEKRQYGLGSLSLLDQAGPFW